MDPFNDPDEPDSGVDVVLDVWRRRKHLLLGTFAAVLAGAIGVAAALPDLYRATAKVIVDRQEVSEAFVQPSVTTELETRIQTIDQQVRSRESLRNLIVGMNLYPELRPLVPLDALVERMRQDVALRLEGVEQASGNSATVAFTITYRGRDPATVADVTNALAALYVEENTTSRERQATETAKFLGKEVDRARRELDAQEQRSGEFARLHADELPQQLEVNIAGLDRVSTQLRQNGEYQLRALERRERLEKELADSAVSGPATSQEAIAARLEKLRADLAELRRKFSENHPDVIRLTTEIAALQSQVRVGEARASDAKITRSSVARAMADVDEQLRTLKDEEAKLRKLSSMYETRVEGVPKRREEIERLSRSSVSTRERYEALLKRYDAARLATNLEVGQDLEQFRILDPALAPRQPWMPNRLWIAGMGFFAALAAGAAVVIAAEKLDSTFHSADDLRMSVNVPMLATIRRVPTRRAARRGLFWTALKVSAAIIVVMLMAAGSYRFADGNEDIVRLISRGDA